MEQSATQVCHDEMLAAAAKGDALAWRSIVTQYAPRVYGLLLHQCGDRDLAEEIAQATFVKVVTRIGRYQERGRFEPWLFRIAMNQLRDEMRRRKRQARPMDLSLTHDEEDDSDPWASVSSTSRHDEPHSPLDDMAHAEQLEQVRQAVAQLGEEDREIIYLRHTAGLTFVQIAEALNKPLGTVLARGHRALGKLRKMLAMTPARDDDDQESSAS
ncbi:MAG: sigma-70 family RNA polymerase sigma factor [Phycisphaeraceae bacterium]|nr:sigma-70 family RNA polymerase sigma factor [Phycisphaeraceae bacterium]